MTTSRPNALRTALSTACALWCVSSAYAGDLVVRATGLVERVTTSPATGPFVGVQVGQPVELRIEVARTPSSMPAPNAAAYTLDAPVSRLSVGAASDTIATATPVRLVLWDDYASIRDEVFFTNRPLAQGGAVTLALLDTTRSAFHTPDILQLRGDYPAASWATRTFYLQAGGGFVEFTLTTFEIGAPGPGTIVCAPAVANSTGRPALINATGSRSLAANDLGLEARRLPANTFGFFLVSRTQANVPNPGGSQGRLCLGGSIGRYQNQVQNSGAAGAIALSLDSSALASPTGPVAAQAGETWTFQAWYRDANPTSTSNFTDSVAVTFE